MRCCCVKYCQNKSTNARLFRFPQVNCWRIGWLRAIKFKKNVSIDTIDDCRVCESHFKSGKWLNTALVFYKALHFMLSHQKWKILREPTHCLNTTSDECRLSKLWFLASIAKISTIGLCFFLFTNIMLVTNLCA